VKISGLFKLQETEYKINKAEFGSRKEERVSGELMTFSFVFTNRLLVTVRN
jgi:hypothetical protein